MNRLYRDVPLAAGLTAAVLIIGLALPGSIAWKVVAALTYIIGAWIFGERLAPRSAGREWLGLLALFAVQSLVQIVFYYAGLHLSAYTDAGSLAIALLLMMMLFAWTPPDAEDFKISVPNWKWIAPLLTIGLVFCIGILYAAFRRATADSIRTPWPYLPSWVIPAIASLWLTSLIAAWKTRSKTTVAALSSLTAFSIVTIAPALYKLGFGFDGFLHRASEQLILQTGTLNPKPFYYIGQYVFTTWLSRISGLELASIDRWLVPLVLAVIPFFLLMSHKKQTFALPAFLLMLPLAPFVATTPQSFAYVIGLISIILALSEDIHPASWLPFAAWSIAIHPLAGLPFAAISLGMALLHFRQKTLSGICIILAALSIPAAFLILGQFSSNSVSWDWSRLVDKTLLTQAWNALSPPQNRVALWEDWSSLIAFLILPAALALSVLACVKDKERRPFWIALFSAACLLIVSGFVLKAAGDFPFLIDYERGNYADRLFIIAGLIAAFPASIGFAYLLSRISRLHILVTCSVLCVTWAWSGAQAYNALPRHDAAVVSHGWSVGSADIEAVRWIDQNAANDVYTVLADQSVSAAAVQEYGFKRYEGDVFFYPIPTGGPLYQDFLDAVVSNPSVDAIKDAARLGHSKIVYIVLNDYWWDFENVSGKLSSMAADERDFGNGSVRVFRFNVE